MLWSKVILSVVTLSVLPGCQNSPDAMLKGTTQKFSLLTYNVKGLPGSVTEIDTENNMKLISELLNNYDIALLQEDFAYHPELISKANHKYKSSPKVSRGPLDVGDGLNHLSEFEFTSFQRAEWDTCSSAEASDCLATKGFSVAEMLIGNMPLDLYNLHMDAGGAAPDIRARQVQVDQLIQAIKTRSTGKTIIVAGDFNLNVDRPQDAEMFEELLRETNLNDACETSGCEPKLIDKILFRSSAASTLICETWNTDPAFVDSAGHQLSDHLALAARFEFQPRNSFATR